jgi:ubiquinone/menaquinone biosynthesis C-methylase UbiE
LIGFNKPPIRIKRGIYDFIGDYTNDFIENYDEMAEDIRPWKHSRFETSIISNCCDIAIQNFGFTEEAHVIDIGCGWGEIINALPFENKYGLDISFVRLYEVDKSTIRIRAYAESIPFPSNCFNIIICSDILEHVLNAENFIYEADRILLVGGLFLLAVPWEQDLSVKTSPEYLSKFKSYKYSHIRSVGYKLINNLFSKKYKKIAETEITAHKEFQELKPYSIKFFQFEKIK